MHKPNWFNNKRDVKEGDVILFMKNDGALKSTHQFGKIKEIERSQDNRIQKVTITYRNNNESINQETRCVRHIAMIHPVDETSIVAELGEIATTADISYKISSLMLIFRKMLGAV